MAVRKLFLPTVTVTAHPMLLLMLPTSTPDLPQPLPYTASIAFSS